MKKLLLVVSVLFASFAGATSVESNSPYSVVVPSINGDPSAVDRVSGQLYFDVSTSAFKGIDNVGAVKTFKTGSGGGAKVTPSSPSLSGGSYANISFTSANTVYDTSAFVGTNQFVAQHSGIHVVSIYGYAADESSTMGFQFQVNSGSWDQLCVGRGFTGQYAACGGTDQVNLTAGDSVKFRVYDGNNVSLGLIRISISEQ